MNIHNLKSKLNFENELLFMYLVVYFLNFFFFNTVIHFELK